jgi:hypothetical protein
LCRDGEELLQIKKEKVNRKKQVMEGGLTGRKCGGEVQPSNLKREKAHEAQQRSLSLSKQKACMYKLIQIRKRVLEPKLVIQTSLRDQTCTWRNNKNQKSGL